MRIAFLIMAHQKFGQLQFLINALDVNIGKISKLL